MSSQEYKVSATLPLSEMMTTQQPVIIDDLPEYLKKSPGLQDNLKQFKSYLGVPIRTGNYPIGFVVLHRFAADSFRAFDATRLEAFANQVATAIQNARLFEELETYTGILVEAVEERTSELTNIKDRVEAILNNSPDGIIVLGQNGTVETSNPAISHLLRYDNDELFETSLDKLCVEQNTEAIRTALERAKSQGVSTRLEVTARRKDGTTFDADLAIAPIAGEGYQGDIVCSLRDITALKQATRMKDAFVSNVSHELRTPITGLKLNHRLLDQDPENSPIYTERLGREIDRLNILIEDLLRLSRLDQGRVTLNLETIDLNTLVENIANDRVPLATSRDLTLEYHPNKSELYVHVDSGLVSQAISVLITNALNYTPGGGRIIVSTHSHENGKECWRTVSVSDNGPGVSREDQTHLFERFYRGRSGRDAGVPGTGLGLAISKEIINLHKGKIEVESEGVSGKGSTFTISIPGIPNEQPE
jgi:PAS domain S-box-containing protein